MISAVVTAALLLLVGLCVALAMPARAQRWHGVVGEAWLLGAGVATLVLLVLSVSGIHWSRPAVFAGLAVAVLAAAAVVMRRGVPAVKLSTLRGPNVIDVPTAALVGGHLLLATAAPPFEPDYLLIWGVKARMFFAAGGIDWEYLEAPLNVPLHPDYPLLVPLLYDLHAIVDGSWPEAWTGVITFAFGLATLLAVRSLLADDMPKGARVATTLILMPLLFSPYIGIAEGPLVAFMTVGVLHVRRGVLTAGRSEVTLGAVFLGLAAWTKNEGLAMILAVGLGMMTVRAWRLLPSLWPALAIPLPWIVLHRLHGLRVDLAEGGTVERLLARLADPLPIVSSLLARTGMPVVFWGGVAAAILLGMRRLAGRERFLVTTTLVQLLVCVSVYLTTPRDLNWHIATSWERVLRQILPLVVLVALLPTAAVIASLTRRTHATDSGTDRATGSAGAA